MANRCSVYPYVVLLITVYFTANGEYITVIPTDGSQSCPLQTTHCQTFSQFMNTSNDSAVFNTSNSVVLFLPGEHKLRKHWSKVLIVRDVSNVTWQGEPTGMTAPTIHCEEDIGFLFADIVNLTIRNLDFFNCGHELPRKLSNRIFISKHSFSNWGDGCDSETKWYYYTMWAAIAIANVEFVSKEFVTIENSKGYGLFAINMLGRSNIDSCIFNNNRQRYNNDAWYNLGGNAIVIFFDVCNKSTMVTNLTIKNSSFQKGSDNTRRGNVNGCHQFIDSSSSHLIGKYGANGLAVITRQRQYQVKFNLEHTMFSNNSGENGQPSISIFDYSGFKNSFVISKCNFTHEGRIRILIKLSKGDSNIRNWVKMPVILNDCNFLNGVDTGVDICISRNYFQSYTYHKQAIAIVNSTFEQYKPKNKYLEQSVVLVKYYLSNNCPQILVIINSCTFLSNEMTSASFLMNTAFDFYLCTSYHLYYNFTSSLCKYKDQDICNGEGFSKQLVISNTLFSNNTSNFTGTVNMQNSIMVLSNSTIEKSIGTAVRADNSIIVLVGDNEFSENIGREGGGFFLMKSRIHLVANSSTKLFKNRAEYGGGIFALPEGKDISQNTFVLCTLSLPTYNISTLNVTVILVNNTAHHAGDSLFNGAYEHCSPLLLPQFNHFVFGKKNLIEIFDMDRISPFSVSSIPNKLCICGGNHSQCDRVEVNTFPGESFSISVIVLGELNRTIPVYVAGRICRHDSTSSRCRHDDKSEILYGGGEQALSNVCTNITYSVYSPKDKVKLEIKIRSLKEDTPRLQQYFNSESTSPVIVEVNLLPCPLGFEVTLGTRKERSCKCVEYLTEAGITCNIDMAMFLCPDSKWVGINSTNPPRFIVHNNCPFDYCNAGKKYIDLTNLNKQCNHNRGGVLCGACRANTSLVLGSSNCTPCSNTYLLLIIPFALVGVALVALLLLCNLTVSTGHINAIIFYANIVQVNKAILFPTQDTAYKVFTVFIAWLNLDLGIETCFYDNMDEYAKVWLQFVFPVYVWILIGLVIVFAKHSTKAARLVGNNSVPVLATLFILSYAKLLRTIIATVSFTFIDPQNGSSVPVWLLDGNVEYFSPKHTALFIVAVLFTMGYIAPLTLLVLFAPCLQAKSHHKPLRWVNRLKPFLDAYQGPYSDKFRYWTGLLLVTRLFLFIVFASNYWNEPSINYFWIIIIISTLAIGMRTSVYKHRFVNSLEAISLLNIVILCALNWLVSLKSRKAYITYVSVGITAILFLVIILYQVLLKLNVFPWISMRIKKVKSDSPHPVIQEMTASAPTQSLVELSFRESLREPLLEAEDSQ